MEPMDLAATAPPTEETRPSTDGPTGGRPRGCRAATRGSLHDTTAMPRPTAAAHQQHRVSLFSTSYVTTNTSQTSSNGSRGANQVLLLEGAENPPSLTIRNGIARFDFSTSTSNPLTPEGAVTQELRVLPLTIDASKTTTSRPLASANMRALRDAV